MTADIDDLKYFIERYHNCLEKYGPEAAEKYRNQADMLAVILAQKGRLE